MTAQRRNLDDPATIAEFAGLIKSQANLDALMLLTPGRWPGHRATRIGRIGRRPSSGIFTAAPHSIWRMAKLSTASRTIEREALRAAVTKKLAADYHDEIDAHFEYMPERVFPDLRRPGHRGAHPPLPHLPRSPPARRRSPTRAHRAMDLASQPRPQRVLVLRLGPRTELLARIAGSLAVVQLNILAPMSSPVRTASCLISSASAIRTSRRSPTRKTWPPWKGASSRPSKPRSSTSVPCSRKR